MALRAAQIEAMRKAIGERIKYQREMLEMTRAELAKRANIHMHAVTYIERGSKDMRVSTYLKLCTVLGISTGLPGLTPTEDK